MHRCPAEEAEILSLFHTRIADRPAAGFVVATAEVEPDASAVGVQISDVACSPVQLVALAHELLGTASERVRAMRDANAFLDLICAIERAQAALDFTLPPDAH
ncbi:hypothetical protein MCBMB27_02610 [Methylobacterium phyllosphaerae]|uniref:Uncharacterized protein n=1 Tax=Methylobacterium phyllosphaerae TaxID=418223 RepID=A0AAE8HSJ4_9HYPH|nr:hypothetical protein [Methylobacterium phyllosphaerae]APT31901.1 hypothetical protein MCBMB27_02610 [Methylobacterium phyllosphaerae]SFH01860.1 hypothetical protein SAMN05192567_11257 [Methylobacterium phyllosphaerae]